MIDCELPMANSPEELPPESIAEFALLHSGVPILLKHQKQASFFYVSDLIASDYAATCCRNKSEAYLKFINS